MPDDTYHTLAAPSQGVYKEKGSKFIAFAMPVASEAEAREALAAKRKEYFDARHHCFAYVLGADGAAYHLGDDGEPSGTAGRPIHGQLQSFGFTYTLVVVVRYFGGVKLGASGLMRAYRAAAREALLAATVVERTVDEDLLLECDYATLNDVMRLLKQRALAPRPQQGDERCALRVSVRRSLAEGLRQALTQIRGVTVTRL